MSKEKDRFALLLQQRANDLEDSGDGTLDETWVKATAAECMALSQGRFAFAFEQVIRAGVEACLKSNKFRTVIGEFQERIRNHPRAMRVISEPFPFSQNGNGDIHSYVWVTSAGSQEFADQRALRLSDDSPAPTILSTIVTDTEGKFYLGEAPVTPIPRLEDHPVICVKENSDFSPDLGEVWVGSGMDDGEAQGTLRYASKELIGEIRSLQAEGSEVIARCDSIKVHSIECRKIARSEKFLEFIPLDGPTLDDMILHRTVRREFQGDVVDMIERRGFRYLLAGPTGVGKTSAVPAAGRTAALQAGKELALITISPATVGSPWYYQTERTINTAFRLGQDLVRDGFLVEVLLDEMDAFLGHGLHEGQTDKRVRLAIQQMLSEDLHGLHIYGTTNNSHTIPSPTRRRFTTREIPPPERTQMGKIAGLYIDPEVANMISLTPSEFGQRVADFLYRQDFVVARAHMSSGNVVPITAGSLHEACPGKLKSLCEAFNREVERGQAKSVDAMFAKIEREFFAVQLTRDSITENTFIRWNPNDSVKVVERVAA